MYSGQTTIKVKGDGETIDLDEFLENSAYGLSDIDIEGEPNGKMPARNREERKVLKPIALKLRSDGYSYKQIGEAIGKHPDTVSNWIKDVLRERQEAREELGDLVIQQAVDQLYRVKQMVTSLCDQIDRMMERKEKANEDIPASLIREKRQAIKDLMSVNKEFRNLLGLDAPERTIHEHEGQVEYDIQFGRGGEPEGKGDDKPEADVLDAEHEQVDTPADAEALPEGKPAGAEDLEADTPPKEKVTAEEEVERLSDEIDNAVSDLDIDLE